MGLCADMYGLPTAQAPLIADSPFTAHFQFLLDKPAAGLELRVYPVTVEDQLVSDDQGLRWWRYTQDTGDKFSLPLARETNVELSPEPGLYLLAVFAGWSGLGDASYGFLVEVR